MIGAVSLGYAASAARCYVARCLFGFSTNANPRRTGMNRKSSATVLLLIVPILVSCDSEQPLTAADSAVPVKSPPAAEVAVTEPPPSQAETPAAKVAAGVKELEWDALIPDDYSPEKLFAEYQPENLEDDDPRAAELMEKLRELWDAAPVRPELDGQTVKLPGFTVPLEGDSRETRSFLLVPYYGACIHVPPPPANQTVYVLREPGKGTRLGEFDVVWVTGTMSVKRVENEMAEAGYTLYATEVAPYEE